MNEFVRGRVTLVTGGTGSIGSAIVRHLVAHGAGIVRVFSRDETKHFHLQEELARHENVRYLVGDVRDRDRIRRALEGVELLFHAAALKHVPLSEYNPFEAVETNVRGTQNVLSAALDQRVGRVVVISSDKAASPVNVVGATKLLSERLATATNYSRGSSGTRAASVRFGNVLGSRGSVVPVLLRQIRDGGPVTVTDPEMTRFVMTPAEAVSLVVDAAARMEGGEVFVLKMPSVRLLDLVEAMVEEFAPRFGRRPQDIAVRVVGRRPGEKLNEELLTPDEAAVAEDMGDMYVIRSRIDVLHLAEAAEPVPPAHYTSDGVPTLGREELRARLRTLALGLGSGSAGGGD